MISAEIGKYLNNSKINGRLCKWDIPIINVFVTQSYSVQNFEQRYMKIEQAVKSWNRILTDNKISLRFRLVSNPQSADIVVHWIKVGRVYEGMCKYLSVINGKFKKILIEIGMPNELSGKDTTDLSIYCAIMHEFGHALGLGHGVDVDDLMYVPHKKNISLPSENDTYVLKQIYS